MEIYIAVLVGAILKGLALSLAFKAGQIFELIGLGKAAGFNLPRWPW